MTKSEQAHVRDRVVKSGTIRRIDAADPAVADEAIAMLSAALGEGDLDAEHCAAATHLRQHVSARFDASGNGDREGMVADKLRAVYGLVTRLEDLVATTVSGGGILDAMDASAMDRLVASVRSLLDDVRAAEQADSAAS